MEENTVSTIHLYLLVGSSNKKFANQKPSGGLKLVHVVFPKGTSGPITISIHDIKSPRSNVPTDSVDFAAKVV